jgi:hypothetical protein
MNKDNFQKVITAIEENGIANFNMSAFIGYKKTDKSYYEGNEIPMFAHEYVVHNFSNEEIREVSKDTKMFNCDTAGCIAGFAVAVKNNWVLPDWFRDIGNDRNAVYNAMVLAFEKEACMFLGLNGVEGENLFYNKELCIWKWLAFHEPHNYSNLKITHMYSDDGEDITDDYTTNTENWADDYYAVDFRSIDWKTAAEVLTRIMNEELILADENGEPGIGPNYKQKDNL